MYKIIKLCGINDYAVTFDKKLDIDKVISLFDGYEILDRDKDSARLSKGDKKVFIYSSGEIIFIGFSYNEVEEICRTVDKV